jgi:hypothetical protein
LLQVVAIGTDEEKCKEIEKQYEGVTGVAVDAKDIKQVCAGRMSSINRCLLSPVSLVS